MGRHLLATLAAAPEDCFAFLACAKPRELKRAPPLAEDPGRPYISSLSAPYLKTTQSLIDPRPSLIPDHRGTAGLLRAVRIEVDSSQRTSRTGLRKQRPPHSTLPFLSTLRVLSLTPFLLRGSSLRAPEAVGTVRRPPSPSPRAPRGRKIAPRDVRTSFTFPLADFMPEKGRAVSFWWPQGGPPMAPFLVCTIVDWFMTGGGIEEMCVEP